MTLPEYQGVRRGHGGLAPQWLYDSLFINNIIVSGRAILSAENSEKALGNRGSAPNPAGGALSAPQTPSWWGCGCCPLPKNPTPALGPSVLAPSEKCWGAPLPNPLVGWGGGVVDVTMQNTRLRSVYLLEGTQGRVRASPACNSEQRKVCFTPVVWKDNFINSKEFRKDWLWAQPVLYWLYSYCVSQGS